MATVVIRYAAPLMAFSDQGRFANRHTAPDPTVSAIQGMVAAAAGIERHEPYPQWIAELDLAIRIERAGRPLRDFHTVNQPALARYRRLGSDLDKVKTVKRVDGSRLDHPVLSDRWYLTDGAFLLALDDPTGNIATALARPTWAFYAGRKSCPLTAPFLLGNHTGSADEAVADVPTVLRPGEDATATRHVRHAVFLIRPGGIEVERSETRNDRLVGFKRYRPQQRLYGQVAVRAVIDWFAVIEHLHAQGGE